MGAGRDRAGLRTRWAAIGAAVAITFGGSGIAGFVDAAAGTESSFVPVTPIRILDSRDAFDVGLDGPFTSGTGQKLQVTGPIETVGSTGTETAIVVPAGATGVSLNLTVFQPDTLGFISIRPGSSNGTPSTANLTFGAGAVVPNAVNVALPTAGTNLGQLDIWYQGTAGSATTDIIVDVVGFYTTTTTTGGGGTGPQGPKGDPGDKGDPGEPGAAGVDPANVLWVAKAGGDFTEVQTALDSITDNSPTNPYVINVAPGEYTGKVVTKPHVDIVGSGTGITVLTSNGGPAQTGSESTGQARARQATVYVDPSGPMELRDLTIKSTTSTAGHDGVGVQVQQQTATIVLDNVDIDVDAPGLAYGVVLSNEDVIRNSVVNVKGGPEFTRGIMTVTGGQVARIESTSVDADGSGGVITGIYNAAGVLEIIDSDSDASGPGALGMSGAEFSSTYLAYADMFGSAHAVEVGSSARLRATDSFFFAFTGSAVASIDPGATHAIFHDSTLGNFVTGAARCVDSIDINRDPLGADCGPPDAPDTIRWAKVDADVDTPITPSQAPIIDSTGAVSVSRPFTGQYDVTFDGPIVGCSWNATINDNGFGGAGAGIISVEQATSSDPNTLRLRVRDLSGTTVDLEADDGFSITVICNG